MSIQISSPVLYLKTKPEATEYIQTNLGNIEIHNIRYYNKKRVFKDQIKPICVEFEVPEFEGIKSEQYNIKMKDLCIKEVRQRNQKEYSNIILNPFNFNLQFEMALLQQEYETLFKALSDPIEIHSHYGFDKKVIKDFPASSLRNPPPILFII
jgi:hypothetical protein